MSALVIEKSKAAADPVRFLYGQSTALRLNPSPGAPSIPHMATHHAIATIGKSIVGLLADKCPQPEFTGATFMLCQPSDFQRHEGLQFGISLCLCRVSVNTTQRNPLHPTPDGQRQSPALTVDLHYLLTAWASTPEQQHDLIGWAMCVLDESPVLTAGWLNRFTGAATPVFSPEETVDLVPGILNFGEMNAITQMVQIRQHPSIVYIARPVPLQLLSSLAAVSTGEGIVLPRGESRKTNLGG